MARRKLYNSDFEKLMAEANALLLKSKQGTATDIDMQELERVLKEMLATDAKTGNKIVKRGRPRKKRSTETR